MNDQYVKLNVFRQGFLINRKAGTEVSHVYPLFA